MSLVGLGDVCTVTMGQAPPGSSYNNRGLGWPLIAGAGDFKDGAIAVKKFTTSPSKVCMPGDILISIRASIGDRVWADGELALGRGVAGLRSGPRLDARYLWHWLEHIRPRLAAKGRGATFLQVNRADINGLPLELPPIDEQRRIAAILDQASNAASVSRQVVRLRNAFSASLFDDIFAPRDSDELKPLSEWIDPARPITYGILKPGPDIAGGVPYVRVADMVSGAIVTERVRRTTPAIAQQYRRSAIEAGDLLISIRGHVGRLVEVPNELSGGNITQDSARLSVVDHLEREFVRGALSSARLQHWMHQRTKGVAVQGINLGDLRQAPLPVPSPRQLQRYRVAIQKARLGSTLDGRKELVLNKLVASLQARAFSGQL